MSEELIIYEAWDCPDGYAFFPSNNQFQQQEMQKLNAKLKFTIEASTWHNAMSLYHQKMGWPEYKISKV